MPRKKHPNFVHLNAVDRQLVKRLGGILRLADGLDRCRNQRVADLHCALEDGRLQLTLEGGGEDLAVEIDGAARKSDLFEKAFGRKVVIEAGS